MFGKHGASFACKLIGEVQLGVEEARFASDRERALAEQKLFEIMLSIQKAKTLMRFIGFNLKAIPLPFYP